jgi:hypothetical protein
VQCPFQEKMGGHEGEGARGGLCQNRDTRGEGRWELARAARGGGEAGPGTVALELGWGVQQHRPEHAVCGRRCSAWDRGSEGC